MKNKNINKSIANNQFILTWLICTAIMVLFMIFIGGITRLTDSGLSITTWKPITGILPPFTTKEWIREFNLYKLTPEYIKINFSMSLNEFKSIYLMEYFHRISGRITGLIFIIPFIILAFKKKLNKHLVKFVFFIFILGAIQGFLGWYMVKSGFIDRPDVSHYRLAMHLAMAVIIYSLILRKIFFTLPYRNSYNKKIRIMPKINLLLIFIQIILGAFVAGLDGGLIYNNFPLMNDSFFPDEIYLNNWYLQIFSNPGLTQFLHRITAYLIIIFASYFTFQIFRYSNTHIKKITIYFNLTLLIQIFLGIINIIYVVPITMASLHQMCAIILFSFALYLDFAINDNRNIEISK